MFDLISDILSALGKNKLRTFLTGFSMAWGVFILMVLLGCGNGLKNSIVSNYSDSANNTMRLYPGRTTMPFNGLKSGRRTVVNDDVLDYLRDQLPQISAISPTRQVYGATKTHGAEYISGSSLTGVTPDWFKINTFNLVKGRNINDLDQEEMRKVVVMHKRNVASLFKEKDPIGEYIVVNKVPYKVIGIYNDQDRDSAPADIVPLSTVDKIYPSQNGYQNITLQIEGLTDKKAGEKFQKELQTVLARKLEYDPEDNSAVWIYNSASSYYETLNILNGITVFLWLIGLGTLIAGIVGISNIMLVTVKERTKEFGIRKALGARPRDVIALILTESLMITASFGYIGMLLGMGLLNILQKIFPANNPNSADGDMNISVFSNPSIDLGIAVGAMVILMVASLVAAYVPARKAVDVKPIEALHYE